MQTARERLNFIDALRGLVIVLMALDHVSHFFNPIPFNSLDLTQTSGPIFMTRWITHLCAPIFIFLAGTSAYLYGQSVSKAQLSRFLLTRGAWLVFLEVTFINLSWANIFGGVVVLQVMWALGMSMMILAGLIYLPRYWLIGIAVLAILGHDAFNSWQVKDLGNWGGIWAILHERHFFKLTENGGIFLLYPLLPWFAVMAAGYAFGPVMQLPAAMREKRLLQWGAALLLLMLVLRWPNLYGEIKPWAEQSRGGLFSLLSFINFSKYPPSLLYLCTTLGLGAWLLAAMARLPEARLKLFLVFGRVPMFFYLIHVPVIVSGALLWATVKFGQPGAWMFGQGTPPAGYEPSLWRVYLIWLALLVLFYFACRWYGGVKRRHPNGFLRYL